MRITANFATYSKRKHVVDEAVASIIGQVHEVRVHYNDYQPEKRPWQQFTGSDYTDRSKFIHIQPNEIAFTCDDDLIYPNNYVETTLNYLEDHGGIVTYHGRKLKGRGLHYYSGHETHHFKFQTGGTTRVDVPGTGVMAFYSNEFQPNVLQYDHDKMVDVLIGLEAAKQDVPITCVKHKTGWIENITTQDAIYRELRNDCKVQSKLCDGILELRN